MNKVLIIILVLIVLGVGAWLTYYFYKKSLVDQLMYNCTTNCDARRKLLMTKSIPELKQLILNAYLITNSIFDEIPVFKTTERTSICPVGYHWKGSLATGHCVALGIN